ncbi:sulfite exporter TauE/SafE family protein [Natrialbaceae archaeon A-chndr2]
MILEILSPEMALILFIIALFAGVGISAIGPGGIFVTVSLFLLTPISSAEVAGTASLTFIFTGLLATALFYRSGEFSQGFAREIGIILSVTSIIGAYTGSQANLGISDMVFGYLLSLFAMVIGFVIIYREIIGLESSNYFQFISKRRRRSVLGTLGFAIGFVGGLLGVGGPVVAVPIFVLLGIPMLVALAVAQVQSIFISGFATFGYFMSDGVSVPIAILVGVPQLIGVVIGWKIAHRVDQNRLRILLGIVLIITGPIIAF